jgi:hypothetical protein
MIEELNHSRRWFQFRLRSLMIGVAVLAMLSGYVARQHAFVRDRQRFLDEEEPAYGTSDHASDIPLIRRLLGDQAIREIGLRPQTDKAKRRRAAVLFPEAEICAVRVVVVCNGSHDEHCLKEVPFSDEPAESGENEVADRPEMSANERK